MAPKKTKSRKVSPTKRDTSEDDSQAGEHLDATEAEATETETSTVAKPVDATARYRTFRTRTLSTVAMILGFCGIIYLGHVPLALLVLWLQYLMVRELFTLARRATAEAALPGFRAQQWYFFFVAGFYLYLRFIKNNLLSEITSTAWAATLFATVLRRHALISYTLYVTGLVMFVLSLKKGRYAYQFGQFAWTHMILLVIFVPSSFFVSNIFEGLIWFLLPCFLIIGNDIMAYLAGFFFGRTPLIALSPKKTWEGFIGGFIGTVALAFGLAALMARYSWMTCPRRDLSLRPLHCTPGPAFLPAPYTINDVADALPPAAYELAVSLVELLPAEWRQRAAAVSVSIMPVQLHAAVLAMFASIIAPFGGFFASGFKRAFKMKDFGDTIPGHGGVTDRFDCQMMMAIFGYLYYWNFVSTPDLTVGDVMSNVLSLNDAQQLELFGKLGNLLIGEGLLPQDPAAPGCACWSAPAAATAGAQ